MTTASQEAVQPESKPVQDAQSQVEDEEREVGAVPWGIYGCYLRAMGSWWWVILIGASLVAEQAATVGNALFLGFWSQGKIEGFTQGEYMIVYAGECRAQLPPVKPSSLPHILQMTHM